MILRLMFALALTLAGLGLAPVNVTLAANSGWGIQLGLDGPGEGGAKKDANVMAAQCRAKGMNISGLDDNFAYCNCDNVGVPSLVQQCVKRNGQGVVKLPR